MSDSPLSSTIPGYVHEIESLRKEIQNINGEKHVLTKDFNEALKLLSELTKEKDETTKELTEKNVELEREIQELKSSYNGLGETEPEEFKRLWREKLAEEITYLRGIVENFSKGGQGYAGKTEN